MSRTPTQTSNEGTKNMQTESTIHTLAVERVATLALVRVVDFEKIAAESTDGSITVEALQNAGDFEVAITPNGRNAESIRKPVASEAAGLAWIDGFVACANLKKKGPRKPKANGESKSKPKASKSKAASATK